MSAVDEKPPTNEDENDEVLQKGNLITSTSQITLDT